MKLFTAIISRLFFFCLLTAILLSTGCRLENRGAGERLNVEEVDPEEKTTQELNYTAGSGSHSLFSGNLGIPVLASSIGVTDSDPSGHTLCTDYDGDGIPNSEEIVSNPFVVDYPRIVTRIEAPITMKIVVDEQNDTLNHTELIEESDLKESINNSMESKNYEEMNKKTTPYVTKESFEESGGYQKEDGFSSSVSVSVSGGSKFFGGASASTSSSYSENHKMAENFSSASMAEKTVFENVDYVDNLDRNGKEFKNETVENISKNYRTNESLKNNSSIGPNAGLVRASLYLKNTTVNMPVKVSDMRCTLSFKTPAGEYLPVKTFTFKTEEGNDFSEEIYGGEELGPYVIEIGNLNTEEVKTALAKGYMPQIHVVSFNRTRVDDSNYNPGVNNLKIVEETAKARTATIKVTGKGVREVYRVAAFDVDEDGDIVPGVSLKKALFNIYKDRIGGGESWDVDRDGRGLTVSDVDLNWRSNGMPVFSDYDYGSRNDGNSWRLFETYIKSFTLPDGSVKKIETIYRIQEPSFGLSKYNPFNPEDNSSYSESQRLSDSEMKKMKYWMILHNGRYFEGDINDPIWVGERYEIVCMDIDDFNEHFRTFSYTPLQRNSKIGMNTRWTNLTNDTEFERATFLGKVFASDVLRLEIDLEASRYLFGDEKASEYGTGGHHIFDGSDGGPVLNGRAWYNFNYKFATADAVEKGVPSLFTHRAEGGINSITVDINEARYAEEYQIEFYEIDNSGKQIPGTGRYHRISRNDLENKGGSLILNSQSVKYDENGVAIGKMGEIAGGTQPDGKSYSVEVKAISRCYGYPAVTKSSSTAEGDIVVKVLGPRYATVGDFTFVSTGYTNGIDVRVQDASEAEYYIVTCNGPHNYGAPEEKTITVDSGYTFIPIENPDSSSMKDPGVYTIKVYAYNKNTPEGREASCEARTVLVTYDKYKDYREKHTSSMSKKLFNKNALDFEVNFNDGSGWYRLKLDYSDRGTDNREIDCRYTSYADHINQKFFVSFTPPKGDAYCPLNVFTGGRDSVDVYIRTVAKPEYRETIWMKERKSGSFDFSSAVRYIYANTVIDTFLGKDFLAFWLNKYESDASSFMDYFNGKSYNSIDDINNNLVGNDEFAIVGASVDDFFFSPMVERDYSLKASVVDVIVPAGGQGIDSPTYNGESNLMSISIAELASSYADYFEVYCRPVTDYEYVVQDGVIKPASNAEDYRQFPWEGPLVIDKSGSSTDMTVETVGEKKIYKIDNLAGHQQYMVAVVACSDTNGKSEPAFNGPFCMNVNALQLTVPKMYNPYFYGFTDTHVQLTDRFGVAISTAYLGGDSLLEIIEQSTFGPLEQDNYFRILEDGESVSSQSGLAFEPISMDLTDKIYPPEGTVFVDLDNGLFSLPKRPRPLFFSTCEDAASIRSPRIGEEFIPDFDWTYSLYNNAIQYHFESVKLNNGLRLEMRHPTAGNYGKIEIKPFNTVDHDFRKGAVSFWCIVNAPYRTKNNHTCTDGYLRFYLTSEDYLDIHSHALASGQNNYIKIYTDGVERFHVDQKFAVASIDELFQITMVWSVDDIDGDVNVKLYRDGALLGSVDVALDSRALQACKPWFELYTATYDSGSHYPEWGRISIDNIRIWNEFTDPDVLMDLEYNNGDGTEFVPEVMYDAFNGDKPNVNGVGFYYKPALE